MDRSTQSLVADATPEQLAVSNRVLMIALMLAAEEIGGGEVEAAEIHTIGWLRRAAAVVKLEETERVQNNLYAEALRAGQVH